MQGTEYTNAGSEVAGLGEGQVPEVLLDRSRKAGGTRLERVKGIEPSSLRIPLPSSANPCVYKLKLAIPGSINYIHLHSNDA